MYVSVILNRISNECSQNLDSHILFGSTDETRSVLSKKLRNISVLKFWYFRVNHSLPTKHLRHSVIFRNKHVSDSARYPHNSSQSAIYPYNRFETYRGRQSIKKETCFFKKLTSYPKVRKITKQTNCKHANIPLSYIFVCVTL